ncbi:hypothetical protein ACG33_00655 [Steroidobacter denitrificans]|uniref:Lipid/polyisoprenoid-binding YceI-like domain-containing protein n=1 Tax=Steroidobacter denitrificans TaxID=465721 RepID=A0A127F5D7_STEDE|nr:YceI family protein [Steroidobacter denitrificans]AMN45637.1 hypothetical protein ACG33_00655 [Steroidobacter denitrificans]
MTRWFVIPAALAGFALAGVVWALSGTQWNMQLANSRLDFIGIQAGAAFEGGFDRFSADIHFDPQDLAASRFDVTIDMASVNSRDSERDQIIRGKDLFDVAQWPTGHYVAQKFQPAGNGKYTASGTLTLLGVMREIPIRFSFEEDKDGAWLKGDASIERLAFGIGKGEWTDTSMVGNEVKVRFALLLKP